MSESTLSPPWTSSESTVLPPWMSFVYDSLESHLKTYESPLLEILPHPTPDRGQCGKHEATKTYRHHFCLFLCCAKEISRCCLESAAALRAVSEGEKKEEEEGDVLDKSYRDNGNESRYEEKGIPRKPSLRLNDVGEEYDERDQSSLEDKSSDLRLPPSTSPSLLSTQLSRLSLLVQPEDYRSWNILKRGQNSSLELKFAYFILTKHPRSAETFCHLRYLSNRICREAEDNFDAKNTLCRQGFAKCGEAASRYHGNYHAWDHRRFLVSLLVNSRDRCGAPPSPPRGVNVDDDTDTIGSLLQRELDDVKTFQSTRVSDACPFKYRLFLVETRSKAGLTSVRFDFLQEMMELNSLMSVYPGHESLWNYRRDLMKLARIEDESNFDLLRREDAAFLSGVEMKSRNDWEITLQDRYRTQLERVK